MRDKLIKLVCASLLAGMLLGMSLCLIVLDASRNSTPIIGGIMLAFCFVVGLYADKQNKILRQALPN
jgi:formate/nitrite transporter FocA (FNT family)